MNKILVTGSAGFIGFHLIKRLINEGYKVVGLDSINDYYDVNLKISRLEALHQLVVAENKHGYFKFYKCNLVDQNSVTKLFYDEKFDYIIHLAAQAGVRYSLINPQAYVESNLIGFMNLLEGCRNNPPLHLIFASSSSVYGLNTKTPFSTSHNTDHPVSLYAATKKSNEVIAHSYAHLFGIPITGLRFFTVYGPWGRPDMAYFSFTKKIFEEKPIEIYNDGNLTRDFTYIDDIINGIISLIKIIPCNNPAFDSNNPDPSISSAPYSLINIGNNNPVKLMDFVTTLEEIIGMKAKKIFKPMQVGDVLTTYADIEKISELVGFKPSTSLNVGLRHFVDWYRFYYEPNRE